MRSSENGQKLAECTAEEIAEKEVNCTPQSRKQKMLSVKIHAPKPVWMGSQRGLTAKMMPEKIVKGTCEIFQIS